MRPAPLASCASTCPTCGRSILPARVRRVSRVSLADVDTRQLSDAELYRHYHRTAPVEDLRFFLRAATLPPDVRAAGEALLAGGCRDTGGTVSRVEWYRRLTALQDAWRRRPSVPPSATADAMTGAA
jgi:hypothetical protein